MLQVISASYKQAAIENFLGSKVLPKEDAIIKLKRFIETEFGGWDEDAMEEAILSAFETSTADSYLPTKTAGIGNFLLDIVGLIPGTGIGEAADVANAMSYAYQGKYLFAGLSLISLIPVVGDIAGKGAKAAIWAIDALDGDESNEQIEQMKQKMQEQRGTIDKLLEAAKNDEELGPHAQQMEAELNSFMESEKPIATADIDVTEKENGWSAAWKHKGKILAGLIAAAAGTTAWVVAKNPKAALQSLKGVLSTAWDYIKSGGIQVAKWLLSKSKWGQDLLDTIGWYNDKKETWESVKDFPQKQVDNFVDQWNSPATDQESTDVEIVPTDNRNLLPSMRQRKSPKSRNSTPDRLSPRVLSPRERVRYQSPKVR